MSKSQKIERAFEIDIETMSYDKLIAKWGAPFIEAWKAHKDEKRKITAGRRRKLETENKQLKLEKQIIEVFGGIM